MSICLCRCQFSDPGDVELTQEVQSNEPNPLTYKIIIHCSQQQFRPHYFAELLMFPGQPYVFPSARSDLVVLLFPT